MAYILVKPLAQKDQYNPNDIVDFLIDVGAGNEVVGNSLRLEGEIFVTQQGDFPATDALLSMDSRCGAHALFQQMVTQFSDRTVENLNFYPRYVAMKSDTNEVISNKMASSSNATELKMLNNDDTIALLSLADNSVYGRSFSIKPMFCLNNASGNFSYVKTGQIKVSLTLASVAQFLFGEDATPADTNYYIQNLQLAGRSVPQSQASANVSMMVNSCVRQVVASNNTSLSVIVPIPTNSFSASFRNQIGEATFNENFNELDILPSLSRLELSFSDSLSNLIEFPLEHTEEIILNYATSMGTTGLHQFKPADQPRGIGLAYNEILASSKLGINLVSETRNDDPISIYLFFKGFASL
jgi:hypothetical protein